jgi:hypothetical protein
MMTIKFKGVSNFPTYLQAMKRKKNHRDHETSKKKSMKLM